MAESDRERQAEDLTRHYGDKTAGPEPDEGFRVEEQGPTQGREGAAPLVPANSAAGAASARLRHRAEELLADKGVRHIPPGWEAVHSYRVLAHGEPVGVPRIDNLQPGYFTEEHANEVLTLASQAAVAVVNARLFSQPG